MELLKALKCCGKVHLTELFPTTWSGIIFIAYMVFFINQGLLVTASQTYDNGYQYNTILAVLITEVIKLHVSLALYVKDHTIHNLVNDIWTHKKVFFKYLIPASLYCLYNNLSFLNLSVFDPTTYYLLLQLRVVVTGVLFQILFNKQLSPKQWLSLIILTAGCMVKQIPFPDSTPAVQESYDTDDIRIIDKGTAPLLSWNMFLIIIQVICSCLAGVYNELLLKTSEADHCNIYIQNIFMYLNSIFCNILLLMWQGQLTVLMDRTELENMTDHKVCLVLLNSAAIGIVTSFFLRSLNSILKTFASALELIFTALLSWLLFGIPIYINTFCAIFIVSLAVVMYSQNPVTYVRPLKDVTYKEVSPV